MYDNRCYYRFKKGWFCTRWSGHGGPCALMPRWWNIKWRFFVR